MLQPSPETRARIEHELAHWNDPDSPARKRYEAAQERMTQDPSWQKLEEEIAASARITEKDLQRVINI